MRWLKCKQKKVSTIICIKFLYSTLSHNSSEASRAREYLNGFELFCGSNQLQIEFAWTARLCVDIQDKNRSWDYTLTIPLQQAQNGYFCSGPSIAYQGHNQTQYDAFNSNYGSAIQLAMDQQQQHSMTFFQTTPQYEPNVLIVTGLTLDKANTEKLFNILR
jgi:hypothetical protein